MGVLPNPSRQLNVLNEKFGRRRQLREEPGGLSFRDRGNDLGGGGAVEATAVDAHRLEGFEHVRPIIKRPSPLPWKSDVRKHPFRSELGYCARLAVHSSTYLRWGNKTLNVGRWRLVSYERLALADRLRRHAGISSNSRASVVSMCSHQFDMIDTKYHPLWHGQCLAGVFFPGWIRNSPPTLMIAETSGNLDGLKLMRLHLSRTRLMLKSSQQLPLMKPKSRMAR